MRIDKKKILRCLFATAIYISLDVLLFKSDQPPQATFLKAVFFFVTMILAGAFIGNKK